MTHVTFSALTLLVGRQEGHPAYKNRMVGCWCGCLFGARCRLAYGPADATVKSRLVFTFLVPAHLGSPLVPEKGPLNRCVCVTCRLTAKNRDQLRNPTLGNRVWASFTFSVRRSSVLVYRRWIASCRESVCCRLDSVHRKWPPLCRVAGDVGPLTDCACAKCVARSTPC